MMAVEGHENKIQANKEVNCVCERSVDVRGELLQKSKPLYAFGMIFFVLEKKRARAIIIIVICDLDLYLRATFARYVTI